MTVENTNHTPASGDAPGEHEVDTQEVPGGDESETVSLKSYNKLLGEKKRLQAQLKDLKNQKPQTNTPPDDSGVDVSQRIQVRDNKIKDLETQLQEATGQLSTLQKRQEYSVKLDAILDAIPGDVPKKFWQLIPVKDVVVDPDTGEVDPVSVKAAVKRFTAEYGDVVKQKPGGVPMNTPGGGGNGNGRITHAAWLELKPEDRKKYGYNDIIRPK